MDIATYACSSVPSCLTTAKSLCSGVGRPRRKPWTTWDEWGGREVEKERGGGGRREGGREEDGERERISHIWHAAVMSFDL